MPTLELLLGRLLQIQALSEKSVLFPQTQSTSGLFNDIIVFVWSNMFSSRLICFFSSLRTYTGSGTVLPSPLMYAKYSSSIFEVLYKSIHTNSQHVAGDKKRSCSMSYPCIWVLSTQYAINNFTLFWSMPSHGQSKCCVVCSIYSERGIRFLPWANPISLLASALGTSIFCPVPS